MKPAAMKEGKLYSQQPHSGDGDFTFSRADGTQTRINKHGLIESVADNTPRLSYELDANGNVSECPILLLEPTRTQVAHYTNDISSANGYSLTNGTLTTNSHTSPDGTNEASTFEATSANGQFQKVKTGSSGVEYTVSAYVKRKTGTGTVYLRAVENTNTEVTVTDEWTRVSLTVTSTSTNIRYGMALATSGDEIYVWGFQVEEGSYATSLIPNPTGTDVARTADTVKLGNFTDMPTDYPFTAFVDMDVIEDETGYGFSIIDISTSDRYWSVGYSEDSGNLGKFRFTNRAQGTSYNFNTTSTYGTGRYKIAIKFISDTNFKAFIDGVEVANWTHSSSAFNTNINDILLGQLRVVSDVGTRSTVYQFMLFNEELSDSELENLTSYDSFGQMAKALLYTIE